MKPKEITVVVEGVPEYLFEQTKLIAAKNGVNPGTLIVAALIREVAAIMGVNPLERDWYTGGSLRKEDIQ